MAASATSLERGLKVGSKLEWTNRLSMSSSSSPSSVFIGCIVWLSTTVIESWESPRGALPSFPEITGETASSSSPSKYLDWCAVPRTVVLLEAISEGIRDGEFNEATRCPCGATLEEAPLWVFSWLDGAGGLCVCLESDLTAVLDLDLDFLLNALAAAATLSLAGAVALASGKMFGPRASAAHTSALSGVF